MQARISGHADDVTDLAALAPADQPLAAEAGIAAHDDLDLRPSLAQLGNDQFDDGSRMPGPVDAGGPQQITEFVPNDGDLFIVRNLRLEYGLRFRE